jgi:hypothetical protein
MRMLTWLKLRAMMALDAALKGGTLADAAKLVKTRMLIISASQDHLVNPLAALHFAELRKVPAYWCWGVIAVIWPRCARRAS